MAGDRILGRIHPNPPDPTGTQASPRLAQPSKERNRGCRGPSLRSPRRWRWSRWTSARRGLLCNPRRGPAVGGLRQSMISRPARSWTWSGSGCRCMTTRRGSTLCSALEHRLPAWRPCGRPLCLRSSPSTRSRRAEPCARTATPTASYRRRSRPIMPSDLAPKVALDASAPNGIYRGKWNSGLRSQRRQPWRAVRGGHAGPRRLARSGQRGPGRAWGERAPGEDPGRGGLARPSRRRRTVGGGGALVLAPLLASARAAGQCHGH